MSDVAEVKAAPKKSTTQTKKPGVAKLVEPKKKKKPNPAAKQAVKKAVDPAKALEDTVSKLIDNLRNEDGITISDELEQVNVLGDGEQEGKAPVEESTAPQVLEVPNESKNMLTMYKPWCFRCTHLVSTNEAYSKELKLQKTCHYLNGNDFCPAKNNRLVLGVPVEETARELVEATLANDLEKNVEITRKLSKFDPIMQKKVMALYRSLLTQSAQ